MQKRLKSKLTTIKLYRIITKVQKFIITAKFQPLPFFSPASIYCGAARPKRPVSKFNSRHPRTHPTTPPMPLTLFQQIHKTNENNNSNGLNWNSTTDIPLEQILHIENLFWMWWLSNLSQQTKTILKVGNIMKNIAAIDVILMSLL